MPGSILRLDHIVKLSMKTGNREEGNEDWMELKKISQPYLENTLTWEDLRGGQELGVGRGTIQGIWLNGAVSLIKTFPPPFSHLPTYPRVDFRPTG